MLSAKKMPKPFWPEAVVWTFYVLNRCPTLAVKDVTPQEAWSGVKPSVAHFRVWGCVAHVHIPEAKRGKLDDKSFPCILLGVSEESKGYRLFDPKTKRVVVSKDVVFEEDKQWDWGENYEEQIRPELDWGDDGEFSDEEIEGENRGDVEVNGERQGRENSIEAIGSTSEVSGNEGREVGHFEGSTVEGRERRPPYWVEDYVSGEGLSEDEEAVYMVQDAAGEDPTLFEDAVREDKWRKAMDNEINSIEKNKTWVLTKLPAGAKKVGVKWIYKTKRDEHGEVVKHKARLVAKGYSQREGIDYSEVFAPVARLDTVRTIIALAAQKKWRIFQLDVKSAFLHGDLNEKVYVE